MTNRLFLAPLAPVHVGRIRHSRMCQDTKTRNLRDPGRQPHLLVVPSAYPGGEEGLRKAGRAVAGDEERTSHSLPQRKRVSSLQGLGNVRTAVEAGRVVFERAFNTVAELSPYGIAWET